MAKDTRTIEEVEEHYRQKALRVEEHYKQKTERRTRQAEEKKERRALQAVERTVRHAENVEKQRLIDEAKDENKRHKAAIRHRHKRGRFDREKLSSERKAEMAANYEPWNL